LVYWKVGRIDIGSGYPADPKTIQFLEKYVEEHGSLPDFARSSWETSRNLLERYEQRTLFEY
jgi:ribonuclease HII